ncbi:AAA-domain-containing protein [Cytidiella melzeri]|nr:AAA-domain-containing protein [Cytidiella melzeri]
MPRRARIHYVSLRSSLVNLPISIYGPLLERGVRPQGLAVHLTRVTEDGVRHATNNGATHVKGEAYVGWTGMASASSLAQFQSGSTGEKGLETVEIDPQFAGCLGLAHGDTVEIGLLHDLGHATSVATEPVSADDWEILELHAGHVESNLLSQVRVAMVGQEINVWVLGRTRVRLQVVSLEPSTKGKALLLTSGTEVSIAPKTRGKANGVASAAKAVKEEKLESTAKESEDSEKRSRVLRVLPYRTLAASQPSCPALQDGTVVAVGFVSRILLNEVAGQVLYAKPQAWRAVVQRIPPPVDPSQDSNASTAPIPAPPLSRVLVPQTKPATETASKPMSEEPLQEEVLVLWSPEVRVPDGHIVLHGSAGAVEEWDHIKVDFLREVKESVTFAPFETGPQHKAHVPVQKLAGVDAIISDCKTFCLANFAIHARKARVSGVPGLLVTGRSGTGKTSILRAVARSLQDDHRTLSYALYVDLAKYTETPVSKIKSLLHYWFDKAFWHRPTVVVFDNIDKLMGTEQEHADSFRSRHVTELFLELFGSAARFAAPNARGIVMMACAESSATIHPRLNAAHIFTEVVHLKPPNKDARRDILSHITQHHVNSSELRHDTEHPINFTAIATQTEGYSATDLKDLVARAVHRAAIRVAEHEHEQDFEPTLTGQDFAEAQVDFVPLSLRDVKLQKSEVAWTDIGGLKETKAILRETLEWPTKYGPIFAQSPLRLRSGLLLYGFPGCGKTLLASAVAKECGLNFISVKGPEILNKYIGASEQSVRELFERASAAKPCVLFFDEFDSIAPKRGHDSTGVTDRVVNQMLTQMDGAEGLEGVYVLAATSRPDLIDSALLRPGRLDKSLLCNMPDAVERKEILEAVGRKLALAESVDLEEVARATEGFSGADLQALVYNAQLEVIHESISTSSTRADGKANGDDDRPIEYVVLSGPDAGKAVKSRAEEAAFQKQLRRILASDHVDAKPTQQEKAPQNTTKREISQAHLRKVLQSSRPSVPPEERERLNRIYRAFVSDRSGELPMPPDAGGIGLRATLM